MQHTIGVNDELFEFLKKSKLYRRESMEDVILRLIKQPIKEFEKKE